MKGLVAKMCNKLEYSKYAEKEIVENVHVANNGGGILNNNPEEFLQVTGDAE